MAHESLESRLRNIQDEFARNLPARIAELVSAWDQELPLLDRLKQASHLAHRLAGSAGTLGQPAVSAAAKALVLDLQTWIEAGRVPGPEALAHLRGRAENLIDAIQNLPPVP